MAAKAKRAGNGIVEPVVATRAEDWKVAPDMAGLKVEVRPISSLKEYAGNARSITEAEVDYIARCIAEVGFLSPVVVDGEGTIICGHAATRAARKAGLTEVPCIVADDLTDAQVRAFRLADNKVAAMATWNSEKLAEEFARLTDERFSVTALGFDPAMFADAELDGGEPERGVKDTSRELDLDGEFGEDCYDYECPHCGLMFNL